MRTEQANLVGQVSRVTGLPAETITFFRLFLGAGFLALFLIGTGQSQILRRPPTWAVVLNGALLAGFIIFYVQAMNLTSMANAIMIVYLAPVAASAFAHFWLDERLGLAGWGLITAAMIGFAEMMEFRLDFGGEETHLAGLGFSFLAMLCYARFILVNRRIGPEVLNIVCRELNQEFTTYLSLVDVTVAFVNDRGVFMEVPISQLDDLVGNYVSYAKLPAGSGTTTVQTYVDLAQTLILERLRNVMDYRGQKKSLIEDVPGTPKGYARVRFPMDPARGNPFYPGEDIPVPGIVIGVSTHTLRTDAIIMDALLGHGVALDNYSLGMQQEELHRQQLENRRLELAL